MTRRVVPEHLDLVRLRGSLSRGDRREPLAARIESASRALLGRPYLEHPLVGSASTPEVFTVRLDGFDCVTYVETVLGLALARSPRQFAAWVRRIRYQGGHVAWASRHHYMTGWIHNNTNAGFLQRARLPAPSVARGRTLDVVAGLPPRRVVVRCLPKGAFWRVREAVRSGDVLCFASTRKNLDIFHTGFAIWSGGELRLRSAARSRGRVIDLDLGGFLKGNTMAGVIVARPIEP
jgi:hypothetical protein